MMLESSYKLVKITEECIRYLKELQTLETE